MAIDLHSQGINRNEQDASRGIGFFEFNIDTTTLEFKSIPYRVKTRHSTVATSDYYDAFCEDPSNPVYPEWTEFTQEMNDGQTYYKFNEDTDIYTELAAPSFTEINDGFLIIFAGERESLDNSQTGKVLNTARNVGMVKTDK